MGRHPFRNSGSQPKAEHAIRCPHLSRLRRGANGNDAAGRLVRHCRFRGSIERRKKTSQETPQIFQSVIERED